MKNLEEIIYENKQEGLQREKEFAQDLNLPKRLLDLIFFLNLGIQIGPMVRSKLFTKEH
jgi:hypothetical protein